MKADIAVVIHIEQVRCGYQSPWGHTWRESKHASSPVPAAQKLARKATTGATRTGALPFRPTVQRRDKVNQSVMGFRSASSKQT